MLVTALGATAAEAQALLERRILAHYCALDGAGPDVERVASACCQECECHFDGHLLRVVADDSGYPGAVDHVVCVLCGVETGAVCEHCTATACDCAAELERESAPLTAAECGLRGW